MPPYGEQRSVCGPCRTQKPYYTQGFALFSYEEPTKSIFHQIKYAKKPWLLKVFSEELEAFSKSPDIDRYDSVVPVPLDPKRERERGFNQALTIARMLKRRANAKGLRVEQAIKKRKKTIPQTQLHRIERLVNLAGAFTVNKKCRLRGKQILLVDDVFTTGSTINECAKILKAEGADRVDFLAIARSSQEQTP